jgi:hypothetical protein
MEVTAATVGGRVTAAVTPRHGHDNNALSTRLRKETTWLILAGVLFSAGVVVARLGHPARAKAQTGCSVSTLQGTYGYHLQGWVMEPSSPAVPMAQIGSVVADGAGNMAIATTVSQGGQVGKANFGFTYQVNSDCTGSMTPLPGVDAGPAEFTVVDGGKQILLLATQDGLVLSGVAIHQ